MRPDRFQVREEAIDELNEMVERLLQSVDDINDFGPILPDDHAVLHDKLIQSACDVRELILALKDNFAVFPITPRAFRLKISDVASRAERLLRECELLD